MKTAFDIGKEIVEAKQRPMTTEEGLVVLSAMARKDNEDLKDMFNLKVFSSRAKHHKIDITDQASVALAFLADRVGMVVMYVAVAKYLNVSLGRQVNIFDVMDVFQGTLPTEEALSRIWDNQKIHDGKGPDNILDRDEAWETPVRSSEGSQPAA